MNLQDMFDFRTNLTLDMDNTDVDSTYYADMELTLHEVDTAIAQEIAILQEREAEDAKMARDIQEYQDSLINVPF